MTLVPTAAANPLPEGTLYRDLVDWYVAEAPDTAVTVGASDEGRPCLTVGNGLVLVGPVCSQQDLAVAGEAVPQGTWAVDAGWNGATVTTPYSEEPAPLVAADREDDAELVCFRTTPATLEPLCVNEAFLLGQGDSFGEGRFLEVGLGPDGPYASHDVGVDVVVVGYDEAHEGPYGDWTELCYGMQPSPAPHLVCFGPDFFYGLEPALPHGTVLRIHVGPEGTSFDSEAYGSLESGVTVTVFDEGDDVCWRVEHDLEVGDLSRQCLDADFFQGFDSVVPRGRWVDTGVDRDYAT